MQENDPPIVVGRISGVYGVRGWVKLNSYTRPKENIFSYSSLLINVSNRWQNLDVEETQRRGQRLLIKINEINTPENAREFIQCELAITRSQLPPLNEGEYYWHDLIGLDVLNQDDVQIGQVKELVETGANDVLVVKGEGKNKILIPLIMNIYVKQVDLSAKTISVDWQIEDDVST